ncbi:MAG: amino acid ABC transporter permease [Spirochaetaceae bacterium]|jgi:polar amino acid transport system permease protein|nr:amino acid ABC transporter permease [Spirochaetaceae bacterium]
MTPVSVILSSSNLLLLGRGALLSLGLAAGSLAMGVSIAIFGAMGRISRRRFPRLISAAYVELVRGTPMLLQILFLFLALPMIIMIITGNPFKPNIIVIGLIAMGVNSGAYTTELIRSGIQGVDTGQLEAARSLGLSYFRAMRHVILPQAFKRIVPPLVNEFIVLIKDSSLVSTIGVTELIARSKSIGAQYYNYTVPLIAASVIYLVLTLSISAFAKRLERRLRESD